MSVAPSRQGESRPRAKRGRRQRDPGSRRVLVLCDHYLPGHKAGGPIRSISGIVEKESAFSTRVVTRDRDADDNGPYPGVHPRMWMGVGRAEVAYLRPGLKDWIWLVREIRRWRPDLLYVNSLQSPEFAILPLALRRLGQFPSALLLAPRGECASGAQALKRTKKRAAKPAIKRLIGTRVVWHATSEHEESDIRRWLGTARKGPMIVVQASPAPEPSAYASSGSDSFPTIVFASRIDRMKGLDRTIRVCAQLDNPVRLRVYGVIRDEAYWRECQDLVALLKPGSVFEYHGTYSPDMASGIYASADWAMFLTHGENFGHAIAEALAVGCPVVASDRTLWTETIQAAGGCATDSDAEVVSFLNRELGSDRSRDELREATRLSYERWRAGQEHLPSLFEHALQVAAGPIDG